MSETFILRGFNTYDDIERIFRKLWIEERKIGKIQVNKKNYEKLKRISADVFRRNLDKEKKFMTVNFGFLPIIIKEGSR